MVTRSKFNVSSDKSKRTCDGMVFDSVLEKRYYEEVVKPGYTSGEIVKYEWQKKYDLQPGFEHEGKKYLPVTYVADFVIQYKDGHEDVIDVKGNIDNVFALKKKLLLFRYPDIHFRQIAYSKIDGGWCDQEYILQQRKIRKKKAKAKEETNGEKGK